MPESTVHLGTPDGWEVLALETPTLPPATTTNAVLLGTGRFVLIDPGPVREEPLGALFAAIDARLNRGQELVSVLLTHRHRDHWGALPALTARQGSLTVRASASTIASLDPLDGVSFAPLEDGEEVHLDGACLEVVATPGHTMGHLSFYDRARSILYGGDMVASEGTIVIDPDEGDMGAYIQSLHRLQELAPATLVPSHGEVIQSPKEILGWYVRHRMARERKIFEALGSELAPLHDIVARAYLDVDPALWPIASRSCLAHLRKLARDGVARHVSDQWCRLDGGSQGPVHQT